MERASGRLLAHVFGSLGAPGVTQRAISLRSRAGFAQAIRGAKVKLDDLDAWVGAWRAPKDVGHSVERALPTGFFAERMGDDRSDLSRRNAAPCILARRRYPSLPLSLSLSVSLSLSLSLYPALTCPRLLASPSARGLNVCLEPLSLSLPLCPSISLCGYGSKSPPPAEVL